MSKVALEDELNQMDMSLFLQYDNRPMGNRNRDLNTQFAEEPFR